MSALNVVLNPFGSKTGPAHLLPLPPLLVFGVWGVLGVALGVWGVFLVPFLFCLVLSVYCSATVLLEGWACGLGLAAGGEGVFPCVGVVFWVCICAPFGMNGVASGAFSGSFRVVEVFSASDACPPPLPPLRCVGVWFGLGFSRNCLGFFLESDRGGAFFGLLSLWGGCFRFRCVTPLYVFSLLWLVLGWGCGV